MDVQPDDILPEAEPDDLSKLSMGELRAFRDALQEVEDGYSYARRVVQGRLDTLLAELALHSGAGDPTDGGLLQVLPDALASNVRGPGLPRPTRELEPPAWADRLLADLDEAVSPSTMAELEHTDTERLAEMIEQVSVLERELSAARTTLHVRIDRLQEELISRYRAGAKVDDLLT